MSSSSSGQIKLDSETQASEGSLGSLLLEKFTAVRGFTDELCEPLELSDFEAQAMPDCSPLKWHLAHTTWFFEEFVLKVFEPAFEPFHPRFSYLFNSYYNAVGSRQLRSERGLLTRPGLAVVLDYRRNVEARVARLLERFLTTSGADGIARLVELGCHHEQQHQELMLTDLKYLFSRNALAPAYHPEPGVEIVPPRLEALRFHEVEGGVVEVGAEQPGFAFDNERPGHKVFLEPFAIADRLVTNAEYHDFIVDGGYQRPELWLDQGFSHAVQRDWDKPLYWRGAPGEFREFTLFGERDLCLDEPVSHVSLYEADAFARWAGARLLREHEWERACRDQEVSGNFAERRRFHPAAVASLERGPSSGPRPRIDLVRQCYGDVWEWTSSPYVGYPGFVPAAGAVGEYNGKFMCNQFVLRGGSCATSASHIRATYRNFFYAKDRWQFSGIRLARNCPAP